MTLYDEPGIHIFMNIDGHFFGTSDGAGGGDRKGGPGWLNDGAPDASSRSFKAYHFITSALRVSATPGQSYTFEVGSDTALLGGLAVGDDLNVTYSSNAGVLTATGVAWVGAVNASGTVVQIAPGGAALTLVTPTGAAIVISTAGDPSLIADVDVGDSIEVTFTDSAGALTAHQLVVTGAPVPAQASGTIKAMAANRTSFTVVTAAGREVRFITESAAGAVARLRVGDAVRVRALEIADGAFAVKSVTELLSRSTSANGGTGTGRGGSSSGGGGI